MNAIIMKQLDTLLVNADAEFTIWLGWLKDSGIIAEACTTEFHHSGGGFEHLFIYMNDKHIIAIHLNDDGYIELSNKQWDSIDSYITAGYDGSETGFGYEPETLELTEEAVTKIFNLYQLNQNNITIMEKKYGFIILQVLMYGFQPVFAEEDGLMFFATEADAQKEINELIEDVKTAVQNFDMSDEYTQEDYCIYPAILIDNVIIECNNVDGEDYAMLRTDDDYQLKSVFYSKVNS